ncbi:MAG: hypothetical protein NUV88_01680 [Candidatus Kaiserbacteria bacterium]|nr:hypothetical protein [Candidatus Kaiserbacteria bacterium]
MLPYRDNRLARIALVVFFLIVIFYAYYEARGILFGPTIQTSSDVTVSHERFITIRGKAERISELSMNGKPVSVTEEGAFDEPYLLANGYNRIFLRARDKYGRTSERTVEVIYEPATTANSTSTAATSTPVAPVQ